MPNLTNVSIVTAGATTITFEWDDVLEIENYVLWTLSTIGKTGRMRHFGYKIVDALPSSQYVFDFASTREVNVPISAILEDRSLILTFTARAVGNDDLRRR